MAAGYLPMQELLFWGSVSEELSYTKVTKHESLELTEKLKANKSPGLDEIHEKGS